MASQRPIPKLFMGNDPALGKDTAVDSEHKAPSEEKMEKNGVFASIFDIIFGKAYFQPTFGRGDGSSEKAEPQDETDKGKHRDISGLGEEHKTIDRPKSRDPSTEQEAATFRAYWDRRRRAQLARDNKIKADVGNATEALVDLDEEGEDDFWGEEAKEDEEMRRTRQADELIFWPGTKNPKNPEIPRPSRTWA